MNNEFRREIIMDNYMYPYHKEVPSNKEEYIKVNSNNESCIDNIDMYLKVKYNIIKKVYFDGEACAICTSSTSIIVKSLIGKSVDEAKNIIKNYQNMINEEDYNPEVLGELNAFDEIYLQPARKNCALLSSKSAVKILDEVGK